jgi:hypothetical protein
MVQEGGAKDEQHADAGDGHTHADDDGAVGLQPHQRAQEAPGLGTHDRLPVGAAGAHGEGQQETRHEE